MKRGDATTYCERNVKRRCGVNSQWALARR
jgi:hypothetical protein